MGFTVEMLPWIGGVALAAALASAIWMIRETVRDTEAFVRDSRARAAEARRAFRASARQEKVEAEAGNR